MAAQTEAKKDKEGTRLFLLAALAVAIHGWFLCSHVPGRPVASAKATLRIGLVFDVGGRGDKSFNDLAYAGIERAHRELGVQAQYIEPGEGSDRESGLRLLAATGVDLVIAAGFLFSDDMYALATEYPSVRFACIDYGKFGPHGLVTPPANMVALRFREEEGSYLIGAIAALTSRSKRIGFVGGMDVPLIHRFEVGYAAGAHAVCPRCQVLVGYAGVTSEAFKNPSKGKELALSEIGRGADVLFHASGSTGLGMFEAARQRGVLAIGVDADQWDVAPGRVLTSMLKRADEVVFRLIAELAAGRFQGGIRSLGLAEQALDYVYDARNASLLAPAVRTEAERLRAEITSGRIRVPWSRSP